MTDTPTEHAGAADLLSLTADIVVAFLATNKVDPVAVPERRRGSSPSLMARPTGR